MIIIDRIKEYDDKVHVNSTGKKYQVETGPVAFHTIQAHCRPID